MESTKSEFAGKAVLIVGGTSGIGKASALAFARLGASVVVAGRRESEGRQVIAQIEELGTRALFVHCDVSLERDCGNLVDQTLKSFGRIDIAFNNAGIEGPVGALTTEQTEQSFRQVFDVNVGGVLWGMKYQIPAMISSGGGCIVNNASVVGTLGMAGAALYVASKHAVVGLSQSAALEFSSKGVRVNVVSPAVIVSPMYDRFTCALGDPTVIRQQLVAEHPIGRVGTPEDVAGAVVFLCSGAASFITGVNLPIDGGYTAQ